MVNLSGAVDDLKGDVTDASRRVAAALPLWVIIVIVVVGTGLLALLVGLCCLCVCRRRRGRKVGRDAGTVHSFSDHHRPATASTSEGGSRSSEEGPGGRAKLRKPPPSSSASSSVGNEGGDVVVDDRGKEVEEVEEGRTRGEPEFRNMAPARKASALSIPPILTGAWRMSIGSFGGGRDPGGGGGGLNISNDGAAGLGNNWHLRRTSNAWIDDDALHGPEVSPTKSSTRRSRLKSWGASIRESWPLMTPSPTLPQLPQFGGGHDGQQVGAAEHEGVAMSRYRNHDDADGRRFVPNLPPPLVAATKQSPPRQLPKPPGQALLAANANTAGLRPVGNWNGTGPVVSGSPRGRGLSYYKYEDTDQAVNNSGSPRSKTERGVGVGTGVIGPRGRRPSADSTMTQILKDTEKRLQDGMATGVAMRNRSSSSPTKRPPGLGPDGLTVALVRSRSRTPSPTKGSRAPHGAASSHVRQASQASVVSEPDSLCGPPSPTLPYHGLTSPSRSKASQQMSPHKRRPSLVPSFASSVSSLSTIASETEEGALTPNTTAPSSSIPFGMNQIAALGDPFMPSNKSTPASLKAPGSASRGAQEALNGSPRREKNPPHAKSDTPLSPVTGNMRTPDTTPTRGGARNATAQGATKAPTPQSQRNRSSVVHLPAPTRGDNPSDSVHKRALSNDSRPAATTIANHSLTSASDKGITPSPLIKRLSDLAPPFRGRDQTPDVAHPSPALSNNARLSSVYDFYAGMSEPSNNNNGNNTNSRRRAGGEVRVASEASLSSASQYSDTGAVEREREQQMAALSRISMLLNREIKVSRPRQPPPPTLRVAPQDHHHQHHHHGAAPLSATVAELRRMNSQISTYSSGAASGYSDDGSSVLMAAVRPESVVPPRRASAARNYHALASPVKMKEGVMGRGMARAEVGEVGACVTPTRNRRVDRRVDRDNSASAEGNVSGSGSEDGVSLYDQDGFYVTPGKRTRLRP
ncbi:hypothetical protein Daus18300_008531 [Diaporthe australafricana]|uniref:Proteophosphoglycan ppg4 n=1 Tax=Diaporthe australafricana TaxID=127596 RepID=A0ABR3WHX6_9PEZI